MVVKYKVHELAKDLDLKSNSVIDLLKKIDETPKKSQTSLTTDELDFVFDQITREYEAENFDAYFAAKKPAEKAPEAALPVKEEEKPVSEEKKPAKAEKAPQEKDGAKPQRKDAKGEKAPQGNKNEKPQQASQSGPFKKKENKDNSFVQSRTKGEKKTINTRAEDVDLDKYNEKYDRLSSNSVNERDTDTRKQKIKQKSQQYNKKQGTRAHRKETEQERLKRIADERSKRTIIETIGDEITVGELASQLKLTASEVIKKLFTYGIMAGINETIDFDTAEIVATELGAKVEKEVVVTIEDRCTCTHRMLNDNRIDSLVIQINICYKANGPIAAIIEICTCTICIVGKGSTVSICELCSPICKQVCQFQKTLFVANNNLRVCTIWNENQAAISSTKNIILDGYIVTIGYLDVISIGSLIVQNSVILDNDNSITHTVSSYETLLSIVRNITDNVYIA